MQLVLPQIDRGKGIRYLHCTSMHLVSLRRPAGVFTTPAASLGGAAAVEWLKRSLYACAVGAYHYVEVLASASWVSEPQDQIARVVHRGVPG